MTLQNLPSELLLDIIQYLKTPDDVLALSCVSQALHTNISDADIAKKDIEYQKQFAERQHPSIKPREPFLHWAIANGAALDRIETIARASLETQAVTGTGSGRLSSSPYWYVQGDWYKPWWHNGWPSTLLAAITAYRLDVIELLLELLDSVGSSTADFINGVRRDEDPLWTACDLRHEGIAHLLLDRGVRVEEEHLVSAAFRRLPSVLRRVIDSDDQFWMLFSYVRALNAVARIPDDGELGEANREIIDMLITAAGPEFHLDDGPELWGVFLEAFSHGRFHNALHVWGIYARENVKAPGTPGYSSHQQLPTNIALLATARDEVLDMTKDIYKTHPTAVVEEGTEHWTAGDELLLAALVQSDGDKNARILQYLREAGHVESTRHLARAVERENVRALDAIVAQGVSVDVSAEVLGEPGMTLLQYAVHTKRWYSAFRLLHHGAVCDRASFSRATKIQLWNEAQDLFVRQRPLPIWFWDKERGEIGYQTPMPRYHNSIAFQSYNDLRKFNADMMAKPCGMDVFELRGNDLRFEELRGGEKVIYRQLWKLFQLVLGDNFYLDAGRLEANRVSLSVICPRDTSS